MCDASFTSPNLVSETRVHEAGNRNDTERALGEELFQLVVGGAERDVHNEDAACSRASSTLSISNRSAEQQQPMPASSTRFLVERVAFIIEHARALVRVTRLQLLDLLLLALRLGQLALLVLALSFTGLGSRSHSGC